MRKEVMCCLRFMQMIYHLEALSYFESLISSLQITNMHHALFIIQRWCVITNLINVTKLIIIVITWHLDTIGHLVGVLPFFTDVNIEVTNFDSPWYVMWPICVSYNANAPGTDM